MPRRHVLLPRRSVSMDCSPRKNGKTNRIARPGRNSATLQRERAAGAAVFFSTAVGRSPFLSLRFPFVRKSLRQRLCPSGHAFSGAKVLPWRNIQVPLRYLNTIFQQLSRFSIVHISRTLNTATIKFCPNSLPVSPWKAIFNARKNQIPTGEAWRLPKGGKK